MERNLVEENQAEDGLVDPPGSGVDAAQEHLQDVSMRKRFLT
jgi:hypothetical protein